MRKKILIIQTGGTVCSTSKNADIVLSATADTDLLSAYRKQYGDTDDFTVVSPFSMLSEDSTPQKIGCLLKAVEAAIQQPWDGIIILHGTDTLPYSATAVGLCFGGSGKCIVFSSANVPPDHPESNALINFKNAVLLIRCQKQGVFCTYRNSNGIAYVFLATRLNMADGYTDDFSDYFHQPYATVVGDELQIHPRFACGSNFAEMPKIDASFKNRVLLLTPYPGLKYSSVLPQGYAAVLHLTYHSGTACTDDGYSLPSFVKQCARQSVPVYLAPLKRQKQYYRTTQEVLAAGAMEMFQISPVAAYVKLLLAYNQSAVTPEEFLSKTYYYETGMQALNQATK